MEAMIQVTETDLAKIREMGVEILCTEENAVIPSPFTNDAIAAEIRRYLHIYGSGKEAADRTEWLSKAVIRRMNKALQSDGSLNWDEVREIIGDCYSEAQKTEKEHATKNNEKGMRL